MCRKHLSQCCQSWDTYCWKCDASSLTLWGYTSMLALAVSDGLSLSYMEYRTINVRWRKLSLVTKTWKIGCSWHGNVMSKEGCHPGLCTFIVGFWTENHWMEVNLHWHKTLLNYRRWSRKSLCFLPELPLFLHFIEFSGKISTEVPDPMVHLYLSCEFPYRRTD